MDFRLKIFLGVAVALGLAAAGPAGAQLLPRLPELPIPVPSARGVEGDVLRTVDELGRTARQVAQDLARQRVRALEELTRAYPNQLEMTSAGPAVRGEIVVVDPQPLALAALAAAGFRVLEREAVEDLGFELVTLAAPEGLSVDRAIARLRRLAPGLEVSANHLHLPSGPAVEAEAGAIAVQRGDQRRTVIGLIDGGVAAHPSLRGGIQQQGFAGVGPQPSPHATAVASLIAGEGPIRGAAPGANLRVADIFGGSATGGSATALVRAINWMVGGGVRVVAISLAGPANPVVARAVSEAHRRGTFIVAPVGNNGPAAPPSYPASYQEAVAVTAVDGRGRVLIEAGRSPGLDYAAPGADMAAAHPAGGLTPVRGTSFAVPLVAGRLASHAGAADPLVALDREASARDRRYGRGLICATCRTPPPQK